MGSSVSVLLQNGQDQMKSAIKHLLKFQSPLPAVKRTCIIKTYSSSLVIKDAACVGFRPHNIVSSPLPGPEDIV